MEPLKQRDMLPILKRTFHVEIVKRKALSPAEREARIAAKAARASDDDDDIDPDDDDDPDDSADEDSYQVSLSSEEPVDRWFGREILSHDKGSIDLSRADPKSGLPLLAGHDDRSLPIGRLKNLRARAGKLKADLVPSKTPRGQEASTLLDEGHREMSLGYSINSYEVTPGKAGEPDVYRATNWTPMEGSLVSVPADPTVGVGRSAGGKLFPVQVTRSSASPEVIAMDPTAEAAATATRAAANKASAEIMRRAALHGVPSERALEWLDQGLTLEQVNNQILEIRATKPVKQPAAEQLQLNEREARQYSYAAAILQATNMAEGRRADKSFELDISEELGRTLPKEYKQRGGLLIPTSLRGMQRANGALAGGDGNGGDGGADDQDSAERTRGAAAQSVADAHPRGRRRHGGLDHDELHQGGRLHDVRRRAHRDPARPGAGHRDGGNGFDGPLLADRFPAPDAGRDRVLGLGEFRRRCTGLECRD